MNWLNSNSKNALKLERSIGRKVKRENSNRDNCIKYTLMYNTLDT